MFKKEIKRKWLVNINKINNLDSYKFDLIKKGFLSQEYDSLSVNVENIKEEYNLIIKDSGYKIRNNIIYNISKDEYDISILLSGNKIINKKRYYIPSTQDNTKIIYVDEYVDYGFTIAEYESDNVIDVETFIEEDYFIREVTDDEQFYSKKIAYKKMEN